VKLIILNQINKGITLIHVITIFETLFRKNSNQKISGPLAKIKSSPEARHNNRDVAAEKYFLARAPRFSISVFAGKEFRK